MDVLHVEVTETGLLKIETDGISQPNHGQAELLLRIILEKAGGKPTRTLKPQADLSHALHHHTQDGHKHTH